MGSIDSTWLMTYLSTLGPTQPPCMNYMCALYVSMPPLNEPGDKLCRVGKWLYEDSITWH